MELVRILTEKLGITEAKAEGGAGLLFSPAKGKLAGQDFGNLLKSIPGINELLAKAPSASKLGGLSGR